MQNRWSFVSSRLRRGDLTRCFSINIFWRRKQSKQKTKNISQLPHWGWGLPFCRKNGNGGCKFVKYTSTSTSSTSQEWTCYPTKWRWYIPEIPFPNWDLNIHRKCCLPSGIPNRDFVSLSRLGLGFRVSAPNCFQLQFVRKQSCPDGRVDQKGRREHCPWCLWD